MIYPWQQSVWDRLQQVRQERHLAHVLLFTGASGCGNEDFIATLSQSLLCTQPKISGEACEQCRSCLVYQAGAHPDLCQIALTDKKVIGIDAIRALGHFLQLTLSYSRVRVATIMQADSMNVYAANSLLKSLEEPNQHTHILLLAEQPSRLLATIRSRCQQWILPSPNHQQALTWLSKQPIQSPPQELLSQALGKPLYAVQLDDGEQYKQQQLFMQQLLQVLQQQLAITTFVNQWHKQALLPLLDCQLSLLHDSFCQHYLPDTHVAQYTQYKSPSLMRLVQQIQRGFLPEQLWCIHTKLLNLKSLVHHPLNSQVFIEAMLVAWLSNK